MHESQQDIDAQLREMLPRLRRFARWLTRDEPRADDLVQATLERALSRWHKRRDEKALRAWLFRACCTFARRRAGGHFFTRQGAVSVR